MKIHVTRFSNERVQSSFMRKLKKNLPVSLITLGGTFLMGEICRLPTPGVTEFGININNFCAWFIRSTGILISLRTLLSDED